jgi:hypothetical protein
MMKKNKKLLLIGKLKLGRKEKKLLCFEGAEQKYGI